MKSRRSLQKFLNMDKRPNLSSLCLNGLPKSQGQKGETAKCQRSRSPIPLPDNYSVRTELSTNQLLSLHPTLLSRNGGPTLDGRGLSSLKNKKTGDTPRVGFVLLH